MQYVNLFGKRVSRFGMGCMRPPQIRKEDGNEIIDEKEFIKMIRYAVDNGVNYFDAAYAYPGIEELLGKALLNGYREKVLIATKCPVSEVKQTQDYKVFFDEELRRLQTDYVDVYLLHCLDRTNWDIVKATGGVEYLKTLKEKGKIGRLGFSFHADYEMFTEIIDAYDWDICLIQLNILDQNHQAGVKGLKYAAQKGIPVVIMEPLKGGLFGSNVPQEVENLLNQYNEKKSLVEWAFRWIGSFKEAKVILSGVSSMAQLEENIKIFDDIRPDMKEDFALIDSIVEIYRSKVRVGCTGCGYCMPCPAGVNIPEIFKVYNDASLSGWTEYGKTFYGLVAAHAGKDASNCVECGQCEEHCPQHIKIIQTLKQAHEQMKA